MFGEFLLRYRRSYDYAAPLKETRRITSKLSQIKLIGLFTRVSKDLLKTEMVGNGSGFATSTAGIYSWVLQNPDTKAGFHVVQQNISSSRTSVNFNVYLSTSVGTVQISNVNLNGRQSKILVSDYAFGKHTLLYSSADVLTFGTFKASDVLVLYLEQGQAGQFAFLDTTKPTYKTFGDSTVTSKFFDGGISFIYTQSAGKTVIQLSSGILVYLLDVPSAWKFWAPATTPSPQVLPSEHIFVFGPYLVRTASAEGDTINISGDTDVATQVEVYVGDAQVKTITWNGKLQETSVTAYGSLVAKVPGAEDHIVNLPALTAWKSHNALPEINPAYDDSKWTACTKTTTRSPVAPLTLPVLFSSDYGFYSGIKVYRGKFTGSAATFVNLTCSGGLAFGWNAWLNGYFLGGSIGDAATGTSSVVLPFGKIALSPTNNVITVLVDYHGHDETSTAFGVENPRGILGASLDKGQFDTWKINGNAGGDKNIDPVRGPMNEGGLYCERLGWHLPGFPTDGFDDSSPLDGIQAADVRFYVTTFSLDIPRDLDVPLGIELSAAPGTQARVQLFVNGYQFGKSVCFVSMKYPIDSPVRLNLGKVTDQRLFRYVPHIGPQTRFPVPPGIINNVGTNTLAISLWAQTAAGAKLDGVKLIAYGRYASDFGFAQNGKALQPEWKQGSRDQFA